MESRSTCWSSIMMHLCRSSWVAFRSCNKFHVSRQYLCASSLCPLSYSRLANLAKPSASMNFFSLKGAPSRKGDTDLFCSLEPSLSVTDCVGEQALKRRRSISAPTRSSSSRMGRTVCFSIPTPAPALACRCRACCPVVTTGHSQRILRYLKWSS